MSDLDLRLTPGDVLNPLWQAKIAPYLRAKLEEARARNDDPKLGVEDTAAMRARIAVFKGLLAAAEPRPSQEDI